MNFDTIISKASKRHDLNRKTIGVDISLAEIAAALFQAFIDEAREEIEDDMQKHEGRNYTEVGKLALLNQLEKQVGEFHG